MILSAPSLAELFESAADWLLQQLIDPNEVGPVLREKISIDADSLPELMAKTLNGLIGFQRHQHFLFRALNIKKITPAGSVSLVGDVIGQLFDPVAHASLPHLTTYRCVVHSLKTQNHIWSVDLELQK